MKRWLGYPSVQIVLCVAVYVALGMKFGAFAFAILAPGLAAAVARPILNLFENMHQRMREHVLLPLHGEHFVFRDVAIHVLVDDSHRRWVSLADARKVGGITVSDGALEVAFGERMQREGKQLWVLDEALVEYLSRSTNDLSLRFRTWLDRQVVMPGQKIRERKGVRPEEKDEE